MWDVIIWAIASPAASGMLYYQVTTATKYAGANPALSFFIGGVTLLPVAITLAYMLQIMPRSGGMYVAMSRLIDPTASFVFSWLYVLGNGLTTGVMAWVATGVMASVLTLGGHAANVASFVDAGLWMTGLTGRFIVSFLALVFFFLITMYSLGAVKWLMRTIFVLPLIATAAFVIIPLAVGPGGALTSFDNTWGPGVAEKIISAATAKGWTNPTFSMDNTLGMLLVVYWAFVGWESVTFAAGEVKTPKRSLFTGLIGGFVGTWALYVIVAATIWYPYTNSGLISAYTYLWDLHPDVLNSIMPATRPSVPLFAGSLVPNVWLAVILMTLTAFWFYNTVPPVLVATSRLLFAQSFDRAFPERFSHVSERRGVPYWGILVGFIGGIVALFVYVGNIPVLLATLDFTWMAIFFIFGLAAMILPFKRPDMFKLSPLQSRIMGIPVITILGLLTTCVGLWLLLFPVLELDFSAMAFLAIWVFIGLAVYVVMQVRNQARGIDVSRIYQEIPPE
jgi:amino acid transporter